MEGLSQRRGCILCRRQIITLISQFWMDLNQDISKPRDTEVNDVLDIWLRFLTVESEATKITTNQFFQTFFEMFSKSWNEEEPKKSQIY